MTDPQSPHEALEEYEVIVDNRDDGWLMFAAMLALLAGIFNFIEGLVELTSERYKTFFAPGVIVFGADGWGWIHLVFGLILIAVGVGLLMGMPWAIPAAIAIAGATAVIQMIYIFTAPLWSTIVIALCVAIIYGLTVRWQRT